VYYIFQSKNCQRESHIGVLYGVQKFYSGSVVRIAGKITFEVYICPKLSCLNPKRMATESSEGNITTFRAPAGHLNEANRVALAEGDADSVISEIPGGGSSSEQVS